MIYSSRDTLGKEPFQILKGHDSQEVDYKPPCKVLVKDLFDSHLNLLVLILIGHEEVQEEIEAVHDVDEDVQTCTAFR